MRVPATIDMIQQTESNSWVPEIRVWCHPHKVEEEGEDFYEVFESFAEAVDFCGSHPKAEDVPLIAFRGYELNLWEMAPVVTEKSIKDAVDGVGRYARSKKGDCSA